MTEIVIDIEAFLGILVTIIGIATPPGVFIVRAFRNKGKCFVQQTETLVAQQKTIEAQTRRLDSLEKHDKSSVKEHDGLHIEIQDLKHEINQIKMNQVKNETYLKMLLDKAKLKHD